MHPLIIHKLLGDSLKTTLIKDALQQIFVATLNLPHHQTRYKHTLDHKSGFHLLPDVTLFFFVWSKDVTLFNHNMYLQKTHKHMLEK